MTLWYSTIGETASFGNALSLTTIKEGKQPTPTLNLLMRNLRLGPPTFIPTVVRAVRYAYHPFEAYFHLFFRNLIDASL